jgi:hypothetical protein
MLQAIGGQPIAPGDTVQIVVAKGLAPTSSIPATVRRINEKRHQVVLERGGRILRDFSKKFRRFNPEQLLKIA